MASLKDERNVPAMLNLCGLRQRSETRAGGSDLENAKAIDASDPGDLLAT